MQTCEALGSDHASFTFEAYEKMKKLGTVASASTEALEAPGGRERSLTDPRAPFPAHENGGARCGVQGWMNGGYVY